MIQVIEAIVELLHQIAALAEIATLTQTKLKDTLVTFHSFFIQQYLQRNKKFQSNLGRSSHVATPTPLRKPPFSLGTSTSPNTPIP